MYNSIVVRLCVGIWNLFIQAYDKSILKKIVKNINKLISFLSQGSFIKGIFISNKYLIENSLFYSIYACTIRFLNRLFKSINNYIKKIGKHSIFYKHIQSLFEDHMETVGTIGSFILFFALGIIGNNLRRGLFSGRSYIVAIGLALVSILVLSLKSKIEDIVEDSYLCKFIIGVFHIDEEGGDKWW